MAKPEMCHCGKPLHYGPNIAHLKPQVDKIVEKFGPTVDIKVDGGKTYRVQRHYIALHGIRAQDLASLGFPEVKS